jgi:hypothetical protein
MVVCKENGMTQSCKWCYAVVERACQSVTEAAECETMKRIDLAVPDNQDCEEAFYGHAKMLLAAVNDVLQNGMDEKRRESLVYARDWFEPYFDSHDPVLDGWVGKDGRP